MTSIGTVILNLQNTETHVYKITNVPDFYTATLIGTLIVNLLLRAWSGHLCFFYLQGEAGWPGDAHRAAQSSAPSIQEIQGISSSFPLKQQTKKRETALLWKLFCSGLCCYPESIE